MGVPTPLTKEQAPAELHRIYDKVQESIGQMPNIFGVVARFPARRSERVSDRFMRLCPLFTPPWARSMRP